MYFIRCTCILAFHLTWHFQSDVYYALWDVLPNYMFLLCTGALYISNTLCSTAYILLLYICLILFFLHFQIILFSCTVYTIINFTFICFFTQLIMFSLGVYFHFLLNNNYSLCIVFMICIVSLYTVCLSHVLLGFVQLYSNSHLGKKFIANFCQIF